ncbi:protein pygopus-like [Patiria miniata]|uniref:PHD-type domain-containing protein n=1 Tax=Patiria miniata TaxID=46514 RepID=A0A914BRU7_PATMI|nr:protein pygopus-like [Patiria miniata]XP_038078339.1 protein pygopus-like [Patiria miniata]XP_038078340.1 protein pygopus-like [Patiria miniata]XP_038078341.1 protein pygopus-like [Patiria miniata]
MPREKKQSKAKRFRASSDSDLVSQTESEHSNTSEPSSPRKKHKKASAKQAAASGSTPDLPQALLPPQPLHASHISAANPFDDTPNPVPRPSHPGFMARRMMNPRAMNAAPPPFPGMMMNSGYPRGGMPPGGYPPPGPHNGPPIHHHPPMYNMGNHQQGPPIFICGICRMDIHEGEETILCESGCNMWFHRVCTGLTEAAYSLLTTEQLAEWACDRCIREKKIPLVKIKPQQVMFSASN